MRKQFFQRFMTLLLTVLSVITLTSLQCRGKVENIMQTSSCLRDTSTVRNKSHVYTDYEEMAKFPGGKEALMKFIKEKVHTPDRVTKAGIHDKLNVSFIIKEDGFIDLDKSHVRFFNRLKDKAGNPCNDSVLIKLCEVEAYRIISLMPRWTPGKHNGVPVKVKYNIPIEFGTK